jgi:hypothetical protein
LEAKKESFLIFVLSHNIAHVIALGKSLKEKKNARTLFSRLSLKALVPPSPLPTPSLNKRRKKKKKTIIGITMKTKGRINRYRAKRRFFCHCFFFSNVLICSSWSSC